VNFALRLRKTGQLIGRVEATLTPAERRAEVAYLLGTPYWGQGYAFEAMTAFQSYLRSEEGIVDCWATTSPHNARSIRLLGRLGYQASETWPKLQTNDEGDLVFVLRG
jgi:[ribosomal protein S5]-alanine N-acetyltransferase